MQLDGQSWWLLVVVDHATRYMGAWITSTVTAAQTAHIFLRGWVTPFGVPRVVLTENGTSFRGAFHDMVAGALGCVHLTTATYRPQGNGIHEASHKALRSGSKALWQEGHRDLGRMVAAVCRTHNTTPHISTGVTPYEALFGRPPYFARLQEVTGTMTEEQRSRGNRAWRHRCVRGCKGPCSQIGRSRSRARMTYG
ncbi:integrase core domain protein [Gregarina niphandrodes]|uniref:Integrase core domain protein n=1 Tax=Gregarina niphandrodes TaxID=110365 RepID=A0A023AZG3_GRENI|nr:integrase core domain protein [Gregarina niphandrodes]EZG43700.1 integrase core domain protein [Gregarina niphandrodes]|eukprot:XP_011133069.1 integrase core domain protein [Gregarina niphandrodes]